MNTAAMAVEKMRPLVEKEIVSDNQLKTAQFTFESKRAALAQARATFLVPREGLHLPIECSLERLYQLLKPDCFFRMNRQFIVARPAIRSIETYSATKIWLELQPKPRYYVFVSTERVQEFKAWLGK